MRKNFGPKPYLYPQPVLIIATYGEDGTPDAMNAAWGGISDSNRVAMYLSAGHKTVQNILSRKAFTVSMADEDHVVECDYVGIVSANQVPDKLARAGLHTTRSQFVDAPLIDELPMALECRFLSFDEETELLLGEIINVSAEEYILGGRWEDRSRQAAPHLLRPGQSRLSGPGREGGPCFPGWKKAKVSSPGGVWGPFWSGRLISAAGTPG